MPPLVIVSPGAEPSQKCGGFLFLLLRASHKNNRVFVQKDSASNLERKMFLIEKSVPMPAKSAGFPFGEMEVGDSFLIPADAHARAVSAASNYGKRYKKKITIRSVGDGVYRAWRVL